VNSLPNEQLKQAFLVLTGEQPAGAPEAENRLLPLLSSRWRLIALVALLFTAATVAYCVTADKWYRAQILMVVVQPEAGTSMLDSLSGGLGGIAALAGVDLTGNEAFKKEFLARFSSRAFTYRFLTDEGMLPILFYRKWDAEHQRWKSADPAKQPSLERAFRMFTEKVRTISEDRRTGVIKVTVDWTDPVLARDWANKLVARFNADARSLARDESQRSLEYLNRELAHTEIVDLRQTINGMIETETRKAMLATVREQYAFKIIDPAFLPGKEGIVWPRSALLVIAAIILGSVFGSLIVIGLARRRERGE
jgi:uncharacterized protein involved in exopolysaccharide biosynthesis